jgi:hypothetical protein
MHALMEFLPCSFFMHSQIAALAANSLLIPYSFAANAISQSTQVSLIALSYTSECKYLMNFNLLCLQFRIKMNSKREDDSDVKGEER